MAFAAAMERALDVYRRPYDPAFPVLCLDETPRQLIGETRMPIPAAQRWGCAFRCLGICKVFMAAEPRRHQSTRPERTVGG